MADTRELVIVSLNARGTNDVSKLKHIEQIIIKQKPDFIFFYKKLIFQMNTILKNK